MIYDVVVAGGGPAGAILAYELAERGLSVVVLEKERLPRYKTCAGGLPLKTIHWLPFDASPVFDTQVVGGNLSYDGQFLCQVTGEEPVGWMVMRDRFDHFLLQRAMEAGAQLVDGLTVVGVEEENGRVVAQAEGERFVGQLLAGADGVRSRVARSMGLLPQRETGVAVEVEVTVPPAALEAQGPFITFDLGALPWGYGWIFPKREHLSVGVGVFQARAGRAVGLRRHLERFIAHQPALQNGQWARVRGHLIPFGGGGGPLHRGRVLLMGDAANLADPFFGEGIYYAVASAQIAADVMAERLDGAAADLSGYTTRVHTDIRRQFRYARILAGLVYRLPRLASSLFVKSSTLQGMLFDLMKGKVTFRQVVHGLIRQIPRLLIR